MADVRSMLRASREARRIAHPNASYTSDGRLLCNLCETGIKTEAAWQSHLHSSAHVLRTSRAKEAAAARSDAVPNRKRKASLLESPPLGDRKKSKPTFSPGTEQSEDAIGEHPKPASGEPADDVNRTSSMSEQERVVNFEDDEADPAALEALERELADLEATHKQETAIQSGITISAAPMTAEEIAAQAREEQSTQRGRRDAELEAEKEDAARLLEDEFEEMEGLEERVRKLRAKREALRKHSAGTDNAEQPRISIAESMPTANQVIESDEDDEDDEGLDDWQFGAT